MNDVTELHFKFTDYGVIIHDPTEGSIHGDQFVPRHLLDINLLYANGDGLEVTTIHGQKWHLLTGPAPVYQPEEEKNILSEDIIIASVTGAVRRADEDFRDAVGSSRHWVRDHFLPYLRQNGLKIVEDNDPVEERELP